MQMKERKSAKLDGLEDQKAGTNLCCCGGERGKKSMMGTAANEEERLKGEGRWEKNEEEKPGDDS